MKQKSTYLIFHNMKQWIRHFLWNIYPCKANMDDQSNPLKYSRI